MGGKAYFDSQFREISVNLGGGKYVTVYGCGILRYQRKPGQVDWDKA